MEPDPTPEDGSSEARPGTGVPGRSPLDLTRWKLVSSLLDELLDADTAERDARLARLRQEDPALAAEVQALLARQSSIQRDAFLEGSALPGHTSLEGQTLGGYTLESSIGQGGMGSVWLGRRSDGRYEGKAAIKFLNLALLARGGAERFSREGSFLAQLAHPHIGRLLDAGVTGSGQPYLVLEYIEGEPIDRWCDTRRASVEQRLRLFLDVLDAVSYAHSRLIVHRDLKPSNILVTDDGQVKLLDFGIAKLLDDSEARESPPDPTMATGRAFTPDFAAPEQLQGGDVTTATDVYALGALLYMLLCGQHPTAPLSGTLVERLQATLHTQPGRMSNAVLHGAVGGSPGIESLAGLARARDMSPHALAHALRGDLDNIVATALKKDPAQRYATPGAMADDLRRYFEHRPVAARADSLGYRAAKFLVRNRWGLAVAAAISVSLTVGAGVAVWKSIEAEQRRAQAELNSKQVSASLDLLYLVFSDADAMSAKTMLERLAKIRQVIRQNSDDPRVKLLLLERLGGRYMELGAIDETLSVLAETRELARTLDDPAELATIACGFANVYVIPGRYDEAEKELADAAAYLARLRSDEIGPRAECWQAGAELALLRGQLGRALQIATTSVSAFETLGHTRDTLYMSALNQLALSQSALGDYRSSYRTTLKARDALKQLGLQGTQQDLIIAMQEVDMLAHGGKPLDALRLLKEIRDDPHVAVEHQVPQFALEQRQGIIAMKLGRASDAVAAFEASVADARAAGNKLFADGGGIRVVEALTASRRADDGQARLEALPAVDEEIERGGVKGAKYLAAKANLALARGDATRADELAARALRAVSGGGDPARPLLRDVLLLAARTAMATQDWTRSMQHAGAAVERARIEAIDAESSAAIGQALLVEAQAQAGRGQASSAASLARSALPHLEANLGPEHESTTHARLLASARDH